MLIRVPLAPLIINQWAHGSDLALSVTLHVQKKVKRTQGNLFRRGSGLLVPWKTASVESVFSSVERGCPLFRVSPPQCALSLAPPCPTGHPPGPPLLTRILCKVTVYVSVRKREVILPAVGSRTGFTGFSVSDPKLPACIPWILTVGGVGLPRFSRYAPLSLLPLRFTLRGAFPHSTPPPAETQKGKFSSPSLS